MRYAVLQELIVENENEPKYSVYGPFDSEEEAETFKEEEFADWAILTIVPFNGSED
jgi:hypothetical protein